METLQFRKDNDNDIVAESWPCSVSRTIENVVSQCHESGVTFYEALFFVLKADYQGQLSKEKDVEDYDAQQFNKWKFIPNSEKYYRILQSYKTYSVLNTGLEKNIFELLIHEMATNNLFNYSVESREVIDFFQARYEKRHEHWLMLQGELGDHAIYLEKIRLHNANINFKWMEIFSKEYIPMIEQKGRMDILSRKKALIEMYPDISSIGLDEKMKKHMEEKEKHLKAMKAEAKLASRGEILPDESLYTDFEQEKQYRQELKKILREIFLLIHPDVLRQNPDFNKLTDCQKESLSKIWHEVMALKEDEIGYAKGCCGHEYRALVNLMDKLDLVRSIIDNAGLDADPRFVIQGDSLYERLGWLERSIRSIETAICSLEAEQKVLYEDDEVWERETQINWKKSMQDELKEYYLKNKEEYGIEADEIETFIKNYFTQRDQDVNI